METSVSRVAALDNEVTNCLKDVRELAASKRALYDEAIADEEHLKDVLDTRNVQCARILSLEHEAK